MTKKKSIWAFVLAFMLVVPAMFMMTACGKHKHSFSDDWSKSETQHWHACKDKKCEEKSDLGDHDFVWAEKTPAGVHTDKVETGTCKTCQYQKDRTVEGTGEHSWEWKSDGTKHWEQTTCEHETPLTRNEQNHTWEWECDNVYDWEQTTCTQHDAMKRNKTVHTWKYASEGELTHRRTTNCGAKHPSRTEINIPHRYDNVDDTTCNDCGYVRSLTGKGSFNALSAKTYNAGAQGVASGDYTVDEAIKGIYVIQYKVKDANDSTYTTTAPTNAGTYEVRIYCNGNATYLRGEVAKTELVINKYEVEIVKNSSFKVAYDKAAMEDANVQYIHLGTVRVTAGLVEPVDVPIKAPKRDFNKNPGRNLVYVEHLLTEDDNFTIKELPSSDSTRKATIVHYDDSVVATLTSKDETNVKWDATNNQVGITVVRVNNGTIRVGDYMICEGYAKPLKVVALKLEYNVPTDMLVNADKNCEIYFDNSSFADLATAKPILANKTFTEVDYAVLAFNEGSNETNHLDVTLQQNESIYLEFTATVDSAKTFKLNFDADGGYRAGESFEFYNAETGEKMTNNLNEVSVSAAGTYKIVIKITKVAAEYNYLKKTVQFYVTIK